MLLDIPKIKNSEWLDRCLLLLVAVSMVVIVWRDAHSPWAFEKKMGSVSDNYFIALNAKNIFQGKGWGLYNGMAFVPFEREISTGPVVFLSAALAMYVFEDFDDARYAGVIVLNISLLVFFLWRLKLFLTCSNIRRYLWLLAPLLMLSFMREQWYLVLGEVAASLLLLISASYAAEKNVNFRHVLLSGLFAGMALMSKLISILCSPWIVLFLLVMYGQKNGFSAAVKLALCWLAAFCVVPGMVAVWHWIGIGKGWSGFIAYTVDYLSYYFGLGWTGKMESTVCIDPKCLAANHRVAATSWMHGYGRSMAMLIACVPLLLLTVLVSLFVLKREFGSRQRFIFLAALICSAQLLFFYVNGIHWQSRYYFIAGFTGMVAALLLFGAAFQRIHQGTLRGLLMGGLLVLAVYGSQPWFRDAGMTANHRDVREVAAYINRSPDVHEVLWINYAPHPFPFVSYYLDEGKTWLHIYGFIAHHFYWHEKELSVQNIFFWKTRRPYHVLQQRWGNDRPVNPNVCANALFENEHFRVLECQPDELEAFYRVYSGGEIRFGAPPPSTLSTK